MVTALTYTTFTEELARLAVIPLPNQQFSDNLPSAINYAELRIYRDLDLLSTVMAVTGFSLVQLNNFVTFPEDTFVTVQNVNVLTPVGAANPATARRNPLTPTSKEVLYNLWPSAANPGLPKLFAMLNANSLLVGRWPDANYALEIVGTVRPPSLSASNPSTWISRNMPDLMLYAAMIFISGYQRNFGRMSDDPQMAVTYEGQYQLMKASAGVEEARRKFQSAGWTSFSPAMVASPSRG